MVAKQTCWTMACPPSARVVQQEPACWTLTPQETTGHAPRCASSSSVPQLEQQQQSVDRTESAISAISCSNDSSSAKLAQLSMVMRLLRAATGWRGFVHAAP